MSRRREPTSTVGWREWVSLPKLHIPAIKAKIDTGARSSALHALDVQVSRRDGIDVVRFKVHPFQRDSSTTVSAEAQLVDEREVKSSSGHAALRPVIRTPLQLLGQRWPIELTLTNRDEMGFRMLLGRQTLRGRFLVDPGRSFFAGKPGSPTPSQAPFPRRSHHGGGS
ncbi:MAG: RimK/LysX family protein [Gemmatimonadales bacterium]